MLSLLRRTIDGYTLALIATIALAAFFPAAGSVARRLDGLSVIAIALLFFLHGARLPREAIIAGLTHWRLHLLVLAITFALFPLAGWIAQPMLAWLLPPMLAFGVLYLCTLPSTVQSSIALTSIARGNVPAAVCAASASNLLGVFATPLLVAMLLSASADGGSPLQAIGDIALQLLLPFVAGHLSRPWTAATVTRWNRLLGFTDRGTVLLIVYLAFSASVIEGLWQQVPVSTLLLLFIVIAALLGLVLATTMWTSRRLGFDRADEIAIVFCGSKKSLATGAPMAKVLFAGNPALGMIVLPVMVYHQLQLMVCAALAQHYARRTTTCAADDPPLKSDVLERNAGQRDR